MLLSVLFPAVLIAQDNITAQQVQDTTQQQNQDTSKKDDPQQTKRKLLMIRKGNRTVHKYVGANECQPCHSSEEIGDQYRIWNKSKHADAYSVLASPKAIKIGKERGIDNPQESDSCLECHITGFGHPQSEKDSSFNQSEGVGCEACHGPGSDYRAMEIMRDRDKAIKAGLAIPNEQTCVACHNENSPTYKEFKYDNFLKKIAHPVPDTASM